jgi:hypothetical protein
MKSLPPDAEAILRRYRTCEMTTLGKDGSPSTWPVCARRLDDGRFLMTTSIALPQKAFNIRRDPRVSLLFSEPKASGVARPGAVLVQGTATAEDRVVTDMSETPELRTYFVENIFARQPAGTLWSSWFGRLLMGAYYMRIVVYVTPTRMLWWSSRDFAAAPEVIFEAPAAEVAHVG